MTIYYDTKKEAEENKTERVPTEFCPLIKDTCRIDCVCFVPISINQISKYNDKSKTYERKYSILNEYCDNRMFSGG